MFSITVQEGQTIYDIAIQEYGCAEAVSLLTADNNIGLSTEFEGGEILSIRDAIPEINNNNIAIAKLFKTKGIKPNSGYLIELVEGDFEGVDYEREDFLV
jgi:hypothetical protein